MRRSPHEIAVRAQRKKAAEALAQEAIDTFYWRNGPCCAGCDWWASDTSSAGECRKAAPVSGAERIALLGIQSTSAPSGAGHPMTLRNHHCGDFKDDFDWLSLPVAYLARIGAPTRSMTYPHTNDEVR